MGPKFFRHLSYSSGRTPEKPQPVKLTRPGIEPESTRREPTMLPLDHSNGTCLFDVPCLRICGP